MQGWVNGRCDASDEFGVLTLRRAGSGRPGEQRRHARGPSPSGVAEPESGVGWVRRAVVAHQGASKTSLEVCWDRGCVLRSAQAVERPRWEGARASWGRNVGEEGAGAVGGPTGSPRPTRDHVRRRDRRRACSATCPRQSPRRKNSSRCEIGRRRARLPLARKRRAPSPRRVRVQVLDESRWGCAYKQWTGWAAGRQGTGCFSTETACLIQLLTVGGRRGA